MSEEGEARAAPPSDYPGPFQAVGLTLLAYLTAIVAGGPVTALAGATAGIAVGLVLGLGGVGTLAVRRIPPPQPERLGLRGFPPAFWVVVLLLLPLPIVTSELHNQIASLWPPPDLEELVERERSYLPVETRLDFVESLILAGGLAPVLEEWFFRGVLLQGLVARIGLTAAVLFQSALFAAGHGDPTLSFAAWTAAVLPRAFLGAVLAMLRLRSGSLLPPILVHATFNAIGVLALAGAETFPIPGFNAPGESSPAVWTVPAMACAVAGLALALRARPSALPGEEATSERDPRNRTS